MTHTRKVRAHLGDNNTNGHRLTWKSDNTGDFRQATNEQMISNADDYSGYEESPEAAFESYTIRAYGSRCETLLCCRRRWLSLTVVPFDRQTPNYDSNSHQEHLN